MSDHLEPPPSTRSQDRLATLCWSFITIMVLGLILRSCFGSN